MTAPPLSPSAPPLMQTERESLRVLRIQFR
jgi:hypothetical protein